MRSTTSILAAIVAACSLVSFGSANAAECVGSGTGTSFGVNAIVFFQVNSGQSCHFAFRMQGQAKSTKIATPPSNGTVRMLNLTSFEYKPKAGYKGPDSFAIETTGSNQGSSGTSILSMTVAVN